MSPNPLLRSPKIIVASQERFVTEYVTNALRHTGLNVARSVDSLDALIGFAREEAVPPFACISVNLPGVDLSVDATMREQLIPYALFGVPTNGMAWGNAAFLWPFAAYQLVDHMVDLLTRQAEPWMGGGDTAPGA